eukprot:Awhi_evm1s10445
MFEARLEQASLLKRILDSIKDLVENADFDCSGSGLTMQAMDSSHVSLVSLLLRSEGFNSYRCDRSLNLGINIASFAKVLKCAANNDIITIKAEDEPNVVNFLFESTGGKEKISEFELNLMTIDSEHLGIPDTEYSCKVTLPSVEFQRICRDLLSFGDG